MNTADSKTEIVKENTIDAPAENVFAALTEPDQLTQWWGGDGSGGPPRRFAPSGPAPRSTSICARRKAEPWSLFAHRGFAQADERYAQTTTGWGVYLQQLKEYLEK